MTGACRPPRGLWAACQLLVTIHACRIPAKTKGARHSPALNEVLPDVVLELVRVWQFLDQVLDGVLSKPKEVRPRYRVGVLSIPDAVGLAHDARPCASSCSRDNGV